MAAIKDAMSGYKPISKAGLAYRSQGVSPEHRRLCSRHSIKTISVMNKMIRYQVLPLQGTRLLMKEVLYAEREKQQFRSMSFCAT